MKSEIRTVRDDDLPALAALDKAVFGDESFLPYALRQFINLFPDGFFVAEHNGSLVGYTVIGVKPCSKEAWLISACVSTAHQKAGIGTKLLTACNDYCQSAGISSCQLTTDADNQGAIKFYERFGFQQESEFRDYYEPGDHKVLMRKTYSHQ